MMKKMAVYLALVLVLSGCSIGRFRAKNHLEKFKSGRYHWNPSAIVGNDLDLSFTTYRGQYIQGIYNAVLAEVRDEIRNRLNTELSELEKRFLNTKAALDNADKINVDLINKLSATEAVFRKMSDFDAKLEKLKQKDDAQKADIDQIKKDFEKVKSVLKGL